MQTEDDRQSVTCLLEKITDSVRKGKILDIYEFSSILNGFSLQPSEALGVKKEDISGLLEKGRDISAFPGRIQSVPLSCSLSVKKLGELPEKKDQPGRRDSRLQAARHMARILSASPDGCISLRALSRQTADRTETEFIISSERLSEEALTGMIRSAYGSVTVKPYNKKTPHYPYACYANAAMTLKSRQELQKPEEDKKLVSWATALLRSLACTRNYEAQIRFIPLLEEEERKALHRHIGQLQELYARLAFYSEIGWSNAVTAGEGLASSKSNFLMDAFKKIGDKFFGANQIRADFSLNYSLSTKEISKQAQCLMEELDYEILRLQQAENTVPWAVVISVCADQETTLDSVTSAMAGTLEAANISLNWTKKPVIAMIGSVRNILPMLLFPTEEFAGFEFTENENFSLVSPAAADEGLHIGRILWNGEQISDFYLPGQALNRHAFICGMTGAGKTNTLFRIIEELQTPFLVIEPVKGEYRSLRGLYKDVSVWTMHTSGMESGQADILRFNPFWFPPEADPTYHIDSMKTIIASAFELSAAMPNILEQCLYNVYIRSGWNLATNKNIYSGLLPEEYLYPTFIDLTDEVSDYLDRSDFGEEVLGNYRGALLSRLKSFLSGTKGILLNTSKHPDYGAMMNGRHIIQLEGLADDADKCLVMGAILVQYYEYLKHHFTQPKPENSLKHIIVLEEAHRLFKNTKRQEQTAGPDPTGRLVESLSNIMAEIRAFGEGLLIVDQSPSKIAEDVIKNSGTKIVHRIDNGKDIRLLQSAMLTSGNDTCFSSLSQGESLIRSDTMLRPCKVRVSRSEIKESYELPSSFQSGEAAMDDELIDSFVVAMLVQNENTYQEIRGRINALLVSVSLTDWTDWYETVNRFLTEVLSVLIKYKLSETIEGRLSVLFALVSESVKRMYSNVNKKYAGLIHMFIMRLLELYRDARNNRKVKTGAVELLKSYAGTRLTAEELFQDYFGFIGDYDYLTFCSNMQQPERHELNIPLYLFVRERIPLILSDRENCDLRQDTLLRVFFTKKTFLSPSYYEDAYRSAFSDLEKLLSDMDSCIYRAGL